MTPYHYYQEQCQLGVIIADPQQLLAIKQLEKIYADLLQEKKARHGFFAKFRKPQLVQGLYLWGGVGIGKTFLMDCFYHCLPFPEKMRIHFHEFMRFVHRQLKEQQGKKDPLQIIAKQIAKKTLVLCFDEFNVTDITDAMILARLLRTLFSEGVCLLTTSNSMPDDLYKNGLQRKQFLPAIDMLKHFTSVLHISTDIDYRLRHINHAGVFFTPNDSLAEKNMEKCFQLLAGNIPNRTAPILLCGREVSIKKEAGNIVWFDFTKICSTPRSQQDYLAIAEKYRTIFISNIPVIAPNARDTITLLIRLIDVVYDTRMRLIFSAAAEIEKIYPQGYLKNDFARTRSRLLEMQSEHYFFQETRPE